MNSFGLDIFSLKILFNLILIQVISWGFLSKNGASGYCYIVPPSMYVFPPYVPHANMTGTAILIHTASITFISG